MKWTKLAVAFAAAALMLAQDRKADRAEVQLQAAIHTEMVDGNFKAAIEQYKKVAQSGNRTVAAKALIHMAECYQKVGDAESKQVYERVLREYADQKDSAAIARARLGRVETGQVVRQVWSGEDIDLTGGPSPDGRYLVYANWKKFGNLAVRDLKTGENRDLTKDTDGSFAEQAVFMPDGNRIIYTWYTETTGKYDLRTISLDGSNIKTVLDQEFFVTGVSRDGKLAAGMLGRGVAVLDLSTRKAATLKSTGWIRPHIGNFSSDGRYITYSLPVSADSEDRNIYVVAVDGSSETTVMAAPGSNRRPFFTPDGARVVFVSNQSSRWDLLAVPVHEGKAVGAAEVVKADVGGIQCLGFSSDGSLFFGAKTRQNEARIMELDPATWQVKGEPARVTNRYININASPVWSPDGKYLAYLTNLTGLNSGSGAVTYVIRDNASSAEREIKVPFRASATARWFRWFPDSRSLLLTEYSQGGGGFRRLDLASGTAAPLFQGGPWGAVSHDGRAVYYAVLDKDSEDPKKPTVAPFRYLTRRDLATGEETQLARIRAWGFFSINTSPDGSHLAFHAVCEDGRRCLWTYPLAGGQPRQFQAPKGRFIEGYGVAWAPHNEGVFATITEETGSSPAPSEIWFLPLDGSEPHKVGIPLREVGFPAVHPSGGQLAFTETSSRGHVSVMQNLFARK